MRQLFLVALALLCFTVVIGVASGKGDTPSKGDWVCWWDSMETTCGTFGWSNDKDTASNVARELCLKECPAPCTFSYCEKL